MKKCTLCGVSKKITEFHVSAKNPDGHNARCKSCRKIYGKDYQIKYKDRIKSSKLLRAYGITLKQFNQMKIAQGNKCAICNCEFKTSKSTHVDHDHLTGKVRSLLCSDCNAGLGMFKEDISTLATAIKYLIMWRG